MDAFSEGLDERGWLLRLWEETVAAAAEEGIALPDWDTFIAGDVITLPDPSPDQIFLSEFREDPVNCPLPTASGRIELYSQKIADMYSLAACNEAGDRRLQAMLDEFGIDDLEGLSDFLSESSRKATREAISKVPDGTYRHTMTVDGYDQPVELVVTLKVDGDRLSADFSGTSGMSERLPLPDLQPLARHLMVAQSTRKSTRPGRSDARD